MNVLAKLAQNKAIVVIRSIRHSGSGSVRALNVENDDGQAPRVGELDRRRGSCRRLRQDYAGDAASAAAKGTNTLL